jgi:hypothetical protein
VKFAIVHRPLSVTLYKVPPHRKDLTITENDRSEVLSAEDIGQHYSFAAISDDLSGAHLFGLLWLAFGGIMVLFGM